mgnify:CR=1 FL=1
MELDWNQKNVLVIGAGISGFAAAKLARRFGASVTLSDAKTEEELTKLGDDFAKLRELGIALVFGPQQESLLEGVDTVIVSPAVPVRIPLIQAAYKKGIRVMSEVELAYDIAESPICAVTGTNGKTTTTTLLGLLLETHYDKVASAATSACRCRRRPCASAGAAASRRRFRATRWRRRSTSTRTSRPCSM